jgi:hypothetical protein
VYQLVVPEFAHGVEVLAAVIARKQLEQFVSHAMQPPPV